MKAVLATCAILGLAASAQAHACLCSPGEPQDPARKAEIVFVGRPIRIEVVPAVRSEPTLWQVVEKSVSSFLGEAEEEKAPAPARFLDSVRVTFAVTRYLKGTGAGQVQIMTGHGDSDCGLPVSVSKRYTIYARRVDGALRTSYCFGSGEYVRRRARPACSGP